VREVVSGPHGALAGCASGVLVDRASRRLVEIAEAARAGGAFALNPRLRRRRRPARRGSIMVGGDADAFAAVLPSSSAWGARSCTTGAPARGSTQLVNRP
jgi:3-hydroxyisobutyrate dehydrogenase-like beta-hydroxyacid dehydrogenase